MNTHTATLDIYEHGMVIGKKHYIPYNTRYIELLGIDIIEQGGIPYLQIQTNVRAGEHPNENTHNLIPIPTGKEGEAKKL